MFAHPVFISVFETILLLISKIIVNIVHIGFIFQSTPLYNNIMLNRFFEIIIGHDDARRYITLHLNHQLSMIPFNP